MFRRTTLHLVPKHPLPYAVGVVVDVVVVVVADEMRSTSVNWALRREILHFTTKGICESVREQVNVFVYVR